MSKVGVLCVDDEAILLLALTRGLRSLLGPGVHVDGAASAAEAFEAIEELAATGTEIRVVVSDLLMPEVRGDDFLRDLHARFPSIRCILLTGMPDGPEVEALVREIGLFASLPKPSYGSRLAEVVRKALVEVEA